MKKMKYLKIFILSICLFSASNVLAMQIDQYTFKGDNSFESTRREFLGAGYSTEKSYPIYDFIDKNGNFNNVYVDRYDKTKDSQVHWVTYDKNTMKVIKSRSWKVYFNYSEVSDRFTGLAFLFAGAIYYNDYLYVLYSRPAEGSGSSEEQLNYSVFAWGKYDYEGNQVAIKEYTGYQVNSSVNYNYGVWIPFYAANPSIVATDGLITLFFGANRFDSHQASYITFFDANDLTHLSDIRRIAESDWSRIQRYSMLATRTVSHSLGQRMIVTSDGEYLLAEAGDAYNTRGLMVSKVYDTVDKASNIKYLDITSKRMVHYSEGLGNTIGGNNSLNSSMGNLLELSDGYLYVGAIDPHLEAGIIYRLSHERQLFVQKYDKNFYNMTDYQAMQKLNTPTRTVEGESSNVDNTKLYGNEVDYGMKYLTNLSGTTVVIERAVKLDNDNVAIIWEESPVVKDSSNALYLNEHDYKTYYIVIDRNANIIIPKTELENVTMNGEERYVYDNGYIYFTSIYGDTVTINKFKPINPLVSISIDSSNLTMNVGDSKLININFNPSNTTDDKTLKYTSSNSNVATVDANGNVKAIAAGSATITITASNGSLVKVNITVQKKETTTTTTTTVKPNTPTSSTTTTTNIVKPNTTTTKPVNKTVVIASVKINQNNPTVVINKTTKLTATINPSNTTQSKTLTWTSSNTKVATVDKNGTVKGIKAGTATITVKTSNGKTVSVKVTVKKATPIKSVKLNKKTAKLELNKTLQLKATINPSGTTDSKTLTWTSSNKKVAIVDKNGKVTAVGGGSATITVKTSNGKKATVKITVSKINAKNAKIASIKNQNQTGKALKPTVTVTLNGKTLKNGTDYTVSYKNNKNAGKATVTVKFKGNYTGSKTATFLIIPGKVSIKNPSTSKKSITVKYTKVSGAKTYQIAYRIKGTTKWSYTTSTSASKKISKLTSGKEYEVCVRAGIKSGSKTLYGAWSNTKVIKVK